MNANRCSAIVSTRTHFPISSGRHKQCMTSVLGALQHAYQSTLKLLFTFFFQNCFEENKSGFNSGIACCC